MSLVSARHFSAKSGLFNSSLPSLGQIWQVLNRLKKKEPQGAYKRSTHPTSVPLSKLFESHFPLSVNELFQDYAYRETPLKFQYDVLKTLPFFPEADALGRQGEVISTTLLSGHVINEFAIYPGSFQNQDFQELYDKANHLIMVHGYGGGLGFFLKNFDLKSDNWVVHAIDLLGYGCSSRPPFKLEDELLTGVENWFHDSFGEWLKLRGLDKNPEKNLIMAHSMGAYLMATYGIKRAPDFCRKLLMVSPGAVIRHRKQVPVPAYFAKLWEQNISPFTLVRKAGPLGSKLVSMWTSRRFANLPKTEAALLHKYAYGIFQGPGSGEYMLNYMLAPGADARHPLIERGIHKLKCKLRWVYGLEDWMDRKGGILCSNIVNRLAGEKKSSVCEIANAGHHLYLDNVAHFNALLNDEMSKFR